MSTKGMWTSVISGVAVEEATVGGEAMLGMKGVAARHGWWIAATGVWKKVAEVKRTARELSHPKRGGGEWERRQVGEEGGGVLLRRSTVGKRQAKCSEDAGATTCHGG